MFAARGGLSEAALRGTATDCRWQFARVKGEIFTDLKIHPLNLCEVPGCAQTIVVGVDFNATQLRQLPLEVSNTLQSHLKLAIIPYHAGLPPQSRGVSRRA